MKYQKKLGADKEKIHTRELERIKKYCTVVRVIADIEIRKIKQRQKKAAIT